MKQIVASLLTLGTLYAGYSAYKANEFGPLLSQIRKDFPTSSQGQPGSSSAQEPTAFGSGRNSTITTSSYAALLLPHLQTAFSPLEPNRGTLSEEPLLRLREILERDHERAEAREAILLLDQIRAILREREGYRARFDAENFSSDFFRDRIARDWLARADALAPWYERAYADLFAHEEKSRQDVARFSHGSEPIVGAARNESATKPKFDGPPVSGAVALGRTEHSYQYQNPLEQNRNPLDHYQNPLEANGGHPVGQNYGTHFEGSRKTGTANPLEVHPTTGTTVTGAQNHPVTTYHPVVKPPPPVVAPVTTGGA